MFNTETAEQSNILFNDNSRWLKTCLLIMFLLAALIRIKDINAPGHLLDREYTSAIFARAYYFSDNTEIEEWRREIAVIAKDQQPVLEPPVLDFMISLIYRVAGREELHLARYLTSAFWLVGGIFMFLIVRRLLSVDEAMIATAYYIFVPMGVIISRSIQPDSLMMMLFLISLYLLVLYFDVPSTKRLLSAAILTGITLLLRPLVIFAVFFAFLTFSIYRSKDLKKIVGLPLIIFSIVSLLPSVLYYGYGILFAGFMRWKISTSFMPYLLVKKDFWLGWLDSVISVAGFTPLFLAVIGFFLIQNKKVQYLVVGLIVAFLLFSVTFTYHIHTHPYYHIQLFPIIGLCMAPILISIVKTLMQSTGKIWWLPITAILLLVSYFGYREVRNSLYRTRLENPAVAWEIGEAIQHSPRTVYVAYYYGVPLVYYGEFGGAPWPVRIEDPFYRQPNARELSVRERLERIGFIPDYFVVTNFDLYNRIHQDLQVYLESNCLMIRETEAYLIYTNCEDPAVNK